MENLTPKKGMSAGAVVLIVIITAIVFGGGTFFYMNKVHQDKCVDAVVQEDATAEADAPATEEVQTPATETVDETANWKTYSNGADNFSFKYPADFIVARVTDMPGGLEFNINPTGKSFKLDSTSTNLFNFNAHQNVGEYISLADFVSSISAASKTTTKVGTYNAVKSVNINKSKVDQVTFEYDRTIGSFYSRVALLQNEGEITSAEASNYNTIFDNMITTFTLK